MNVRVTSSGKTSTTSLHARHPSHRRNKESSSGPFIADYPRRLAIDCAADGTEEWAPCWNGSVAGLLLRSVLDDPARASALIPIDRDGVRRVRLTQTAVDRMNGWSIAEIAVLGR